MADQFWVDTDGLETDASGFRSAGERVHGIASSFAAATGSYGDCWGNDDIGAKFAEGYLPKHRQFLDGLYQLGRAIRATGDGVAQMAEGFEGAERSAGTKARGLRTEFGQPEAPPADGGTPPGEPTAVGRRRVHRVGTDAEVPAVPGSADT